MANVNFPYTFLMNLFVLVIITLFLFVIKLIVVHNFPSPFNVANGYFAILWSIIVILLCTMWCLDTIPVICVFIHMYASTTNLLVHIAAYVA